MSKTLTIRLNTYYYSLLNICSNFYNLSKSTIVTYMLYNFNTQRKKEKTIKEQRTPTPSSLKDVFLSNIEPNKYDNIKCLDDNIKTFDYKKRDLVKTTFALNAEVYNLISYLKELYGITKEQIVNYLCSINKNVLLNSDRALRRTNVNTIKTDNEIKLSKREYSLINTLLNAKEKNNNRFNMGKFNMNMKALKQTGVVSK